MPDPIIAVETQPICPYCHRLYSRKHGKARQGCCNKKACLEKHHKAQHQHELEQRRKRYYEGKGPDQRRNHLGQENPKEILYYPERKSRFTWRNNPFGYICNNPRCKRVIKWLYKDGEVFRSPRMYCENHNCQMIRDKLASITIETASYPNRKFPATIND